MLIPTSVGWLVAGFSRNEYFQYLPESTAFRRVVIQCHPPSDLAVYRLVDRTEPPTAQFALDVIVIDDLPGLQRFHHAIQNARLPCELLCNYTSQCRAPDARDRIAALLSPQLAGARDRPSWVRPCSRPAGAPSGQRRAAWQWQ